MKMIILILSIIINLIKIKTLKLHFTSGFKFLPRHTTEPSNTFCVSMLYISQLLTNAERWSPRGSPHIQDLVYFCEHFFYIPTTHFEFKKK